MLYTILIVFLVLALIGGFGGWVGGPGYGYGHWGNGGIGLVLVIVLILFLVGRV